jgi:hypothetical protein
VPYVGARYPGAPDDGGIEAGANCQRFAYALLRHNGRTIGDFRSSDLWLDTTDTYVAVEPAPLDLLLFNRTEDAWGAHVAVFLGDNRAIHLAKHVGRPAIWPFEEFANEPRYRCLIGAKRTCR